MFQQKILLNSILIRIVLLWLGLTTGYARAQSQQTVVGQHIVTFSPSVQVTPKGMNCIGLIYSANRVIMPSECAGAAKKAMSEHSVEVLNRSGTVIGQLERRETNSLLQLLKYPPAINRLISFTPSKTATETSQEFPRFFHTSRHHSSQLSSPFYLWSNNPGSRSPQWQEFQSIRTTEPGHYTLPLKDEPSRYTMGAPVIDNKGRVVCLMTGANECQGLATTIGDDESCQMNCLKCTDYSWDSCTYGTGVGTCTNPDSGETCDVAVYRIGDQTEVEDTTVTCTGSAGCGLVLCPYGCDPQDSCDCIASYGFDKDSFNLVDPDGCIDELYNAGCDGGGGWALIGGMAVLGVTAVAITTAIVCGIIYCKYRKRSSYKALPGSQ